MSKMGRPFNTSQPLGQLMSAHHLTVKEVSYATEINERTLSDYLNGRKGISNKHLVRLCALFDCEPEEL